MLLPGEQQHDPAATARFVREIEVLAALRHPNVVELLDHGEDLALGPYLVMPLIEGRTLRELAATTKLGIEAVLLLLREIVEGLTMIHGAGLFHRDLKPDNVLFSSDGRVTIVDFGLALGDDHSRHTTLGAVAGSVPYMSPERIEGGSGGPASDVWALGVMTYELLAGRRPFQRGTQSEEVAAILGGAHASLRRIDGARLPSAFAEMLSSCLAPRPADRPESATLLSSVMAQIDWVAPEQIPDELGRLARDPEGYRRELAELLAERLRREAEQAISRGDSFAAIERLERALAFRPEDGELLALLDRASSIAPPFDPAVTREPEASPLGSVVTDRKAIATTRSSPPIAGSPARSGRSMLAITLAVTAVLATAALSLAQRGAPSAPARSASSTEATGAETPPTSVSPVVASALAPSASTAPEDAGAAAIAPVIAPPAASARSSPHVSAALPPTPPRSSASAGAALAALPQCRRVLELYCSPEWKRTDGGAQCASWPHILADFLAMPPDSWARTDGNCRAALSAGAATLKERQRWLDGGFAP